MNWLTSPVKPEGVGEQWVNVQVELEPRSGKFDNSLTLSCSNQCIDQEDGSHSARIWKKQKVESDSYVLGDSEANIVLPTDFTLPPADVPDTVDLDVKLVRVNLDSGSRDTTPSLRETPATDSTGTHEIRTFSANMVFEIRSEEEVKEMSLLLAYDVQFVTAHPCVPSMHSIIVEEANQPQLGGSASDIDLHTRMRRPSGPHTMFTG